MKLKAHECPYSAKVMVWVISIDLFSTTGNDEAGVAMMDCLTPEERMIVFKAIEWYRQHPDWDRKTYI
jgi:hypothetical protein